MRHVFLTFTRWGARPIIVDKIKTASPAKPVIARHIAVNNISTEALSIR